MAALAGILSAGLTAFTGWVALFVSARIAASITLAAIFTAIVVASIAGINGLVAGISMLLSDDLSRAASWFMPDNAVQCLGALFAAAMVRALFNFQQFVLLLWSQALG